MIASLSDETMGLKAYLNDIDGSRRHHAKGMRITARYRRDPKEEVTLQYPESGGRSPTGIAASSTTTSRSAPRARCA